MVLERIICFFYSLIFLLASQTCYRWRRVSNSIWSSTKQKEGISEFLRRQLFDYYLPYSRLEYYDRDYETMKLSMFWPKKQPVTMGVDIRSSKALPELKQVLRDVLRIKFDDEEIGNRFYGSGRGEYQWENHRVISSFSCLIQVNSTLFAGTQY